LPTCGFGHHQVAARSRGDGSCVAAVPMKGSMCSKMEAGYAVTRQYGFPPCELRGSRGRRRGPGFRFPRRPPATDARRRCPGTGRSSSCPAWNQGVGQAQEAGGVRGVGGLVRSGGRGHRRERGAAEPHWHRPQVGWLRSARRPAPLTALLETLELRSERDQSGLARGLGRVEGRLCLRPTVTSASTLSRHAQ